jgi:hypothetical protein
MSSIIKDGTGDCFKAKVNSQNRLHTNSVILEDNDMSALKGKAYITNTSQLTLTSANASAVLYLKNTGNEDIITNRFSISLSDSTNGSGRMLFEIIRNPTAISTSTVLTPVNRNFGSNNIVTVDAIEGDEAATFTGGTVLSRTLFAVNTSVLATISFVIPKGTSIGFRITPPTGNTSLDVIAGINIHLDGFNE